MHDNPRHTLYLLRHAHAEPWTPDTEDFDRALDAHGRRHMQRLSAWFEATLQSPEAILCSPAARTRETLARLTRGRSDVTELTDYHPGIYEATPGTLQALVGEAFRTAGKVLLVGHNPGLEYLLRAVLRQADAGKVTKMHAGTLAVIEFKRGWVSDAGKGILRHWVVRGEPRIPGDPGS